MAYNNSGNGGGYGSNNRYGGNRSDNGYRSGGGANTNRGAQQTAVQTPHVKLTDQEYVDRAEGVIKKLDDERKLLTTSKIRNLLSMISSLYDEVRRSTSDKLSAEAMSQIQYIRLHFAYEAGRDKNVKAFVEEADILRHIKDIGDSKAQFMLFCRYMEALVAYRKYLGGRDE